MDFTVVPFGVQRSQKVFSCTADFLGHKNACCPDFKEEVTVHQFREFFGSLCDIIVSSPYSCVCMVFPKRRSKKSPCCLCCVVSALPVCSSTVRATKNRRSMSSCAHFSNFYSVAVYDTHARVVVFSNVFERDTVRVLLLMTQSSHFLCSICSLAMVHRDWLLCPSVAFIRTSG